MGRAVFSTLTLVLAGAFLSCSVAPQGQQQDDEPATSSTALHQWEVDYPTAAAALDEYIDNYVNSSDPTITDVRVALAYDEWAKRFPEAEEAKEYAIAQDGARILKDDFPQAAADLLRLNERYPLQMREYLALDFTRSPAARQKAQEWGTSPSNQQFVESFRRVVETHRVLVEMPAPSACFFLYDDFCGDSPVKQSTTPSIPRELELEALSMKARPS